MVTTVVIFFLTLAGASIVIQKHRSELRHSSGMFYSLFFYHLLFFGIYSAYTYENGSDAGFYYIKISEIFAHRPWDSFYGVGTNFIHWLIYPMIHYLNLSFHAIMILFAFFGYIGFFYFYLFMVERVQYRHRFWGIDFIWLVLFLPNMHFWTVSLGKGSIIFMGIGLMFYGLGNITKRIIPLALGTLIVFHVRSHILLGVMFALALTALFSSRGVKTWQKIMVLVIALVATVPVLETFLEYAHIDDTSTENLEGFTQHRGSELSKAGSGVDISNYNQAMKLFTFLFRPLFVDAPSAMGLMVSFENLLYLFLFIKIISPKFLRYLIGAPWLVKASLVAFFIISIALAQISGNMGLAIRQKSQVMYLFFFVLIAYADYRYNLDRKVIIGE